MTLPTLFTIMLSVTSLTILVVALRRRFLTFTGALFVLATTVFHALA